jgi:hypothetical protein
MTMTNYIDLSNGAKRTHVLDAAGLRDRIGKHVPACELLEVEFIDSASGGFCAGRMGDVPIMYPVILVQHGWKVTADPAARLAARLPPR